MPRRRAPLLLAGLLTLAACGGERTAADAGAASDSAIVLVDDLGATVRIPRPARRMVSLMPSATETLIALGAGSWLVGRTDFDAGLGVDSLPSIGGAVEPNLEVLASLRPDLVVGWESSGNPELRARIEALGIPFFAVRAVDTADVYRLATNLGRLTGRGAAADSLNRDIRGELAAVLESVQGRRRPTVFYLVWDEPPMTTGAGTFIAEVIEVAGGQPLFADMRQQWPTVSVEEIVRRQPEVVLVPSGDGGVEGAAELRARPGWRELAAVREGRTHTVPVELMQRPGPRLGEAARHLRGLIHGEGP